MAKRFTDTEKWDRPWFRKLPQSYRDLWLYILDKCDMAGVWYVDMEMASFATGHKLSYEDAITFLSKQVVSFESNSKWFIEAFVDFQYGKLSTACKPHIAVLSLMRKHGLDTLSKGYPKGMDTLKDKDKDKDKDVVKERGSGGKQAFIKPAAEEVRSYCRERRNRVDVERWLAHYESNGWKVGKNPMKDWQAAVRTWERSDFVSPSPAHQAPLNQPPAPSAPIISEEEAQWRREMDEKRKEWNRRQKNGEVKPGEQPPWLPPWSAVRLKTSVEGLDMPKR